MAGLDHDCPPPSSSYPFPSSFPSLHHHSHFASTPQPHLHSQYRKNDHQAEKDDLQHRPQHLHQQFQRRRLQLHHRHIQQALDPAHLHQTLQEQEQFQAVQEHEEQQQQQLLQQYHSQHESQSSEEEDDSSSGHRSKKKAKKASAGGDSHGEVLEFGKRARGRPPGSKNKPKPPLVITQDSDEAMRPHILEIAGGCDVTECLASFARRRQRGFCLLTGSGAVANVTLRQPLAEGATVTFHGRFEILSMSGCYLPSPVAPCGLTISLAGSQGQVVGGSVVGALLAASPVLIIAASFLSAPYERLSTANQEVEDPSNPTISNLNMTHSITNLSMNTDPPNSISSQNHNSSHIPNHNSNHNLLNINTTPNPTSSNHPNQSITNLNINAIPNLTSTHSSSHNSTNLNINTNSNHNITTLNVNTPSSHNIKINASLTPYLNREPSCSENMHTFFNPSLITSMNCQLPQEVLAWAAQHPPPHHFMQ